MAFNFLNIKNISVLKNAYPTISNKHPQINIDNSNKYKSTIVTIEDVIDMTPYDTSDTYKKICIKDIETQERAELHFKNLNFNKYDIGIYIIDDEGNKWLKMNT